MKGVVSSRGREGNLNEIGGVLQISKHVRNEIGVRNL